LLFLTVLFMIVCFCCQL